MVDGTGLENRHTRKGIGGSNPSLSAMLSGGIREAQNFRSRLPVPRGPASPRLIVLSSNPTLSSIFLLSGACKLVCALAFLGQQEKMRVLDMSPFAKKEAPCEMGLRST